MSYVCAKDNPYRMQHLEAVLSYDPELHGTSWCEILEKWKRFNYYAAVVGPHGSGKSCFFRALKSILEEQQQSVEILFLNDRKRNLSSRELATVFASNSILLFDGAELMNPVQWFLFRIITRNRKVIFSLHKRSKIPVLFETYMNLEILQKLNARILEDHNISEDKMRALLTAHNGNAREIFWELYESFPEMPLSF